MENASKALLIAGGILILIILVSLVLLVKNNVTNFYASEDELQMIADKTKFNEQFTRFNRDDVAGYELISLTNKVIDYNERLSYATTVGNDSQAEPVSLSITLWSSTDEGEKVKDLFTHDGNLRLFASDNSVFKLVEESTTNGSVALNNNNTQGTKLKNILETVKTIEKKWPKVSVLTKKVSNIILTTKLKGELKYKEKKWNFNKTLSDSDDKEYDRQEMISALSSYRTATGDQDSYSLTAEDDYDTVKNRYLNMLNNKYTANNILKYYEYTQFTKAKFKCIKLDYSDTTGKVINLEFRFTGEIE